MLFHTVEHKSNRKLEKFFREQEDYDCPGSLTWAKIGNESDGFSGIRDAD